MFYLSVPDGFYVAIDVCRSFTDVAVAFFRLRSRTDVISAVSAAISLSVSATADFRFVYLAVTVAIGLCSHCFD